MEKLELKSVNHQEEENKVANTQPTNYQLIPSLNFLDENTKIYIKRDKESCCYCCCVKKRIFYISKSPSVTPDTLQGIDESCLCTFFLPSKMRKFTLLFGRDNIELGRFEKDFSLGIYCFAPTIRVFLDSQYIGMAKVPCTICPCPNCIQHYQFLLCCYYFTKVPTMDIYDKEGKKIYTITHTCPAATLFCAVAKYFEYCRCCNIMRFSIFQKNSKKENGYIEKDLSFCAFCGYDESTLILPQTANKEQKLLLISASIFIDYLYFEDINFCARIKK